MSWIQLYGVPPDGTSGHLARHRPRRSRRVLAGGETPKIGGKLGPAKTNHVGRHRPVPRGLRPPVRRRRARLASVIVVISALAVIVSAFLVLGARNPKQATQPSQPHRSSALPTAPESYLGVYAS